MNLHQDDEIVRDCGREASLEAGRAAGYCWERNPNGRGLCTRPPDHGDEHKDVYARTEWP